MGLAWAQGLSLCLHREGQGKGISLLVWHGVMHRLRADVPHNLSSLKLLLSTSVPFKPVLYSTGALESTSHTFCMNGFSLSENYQSIKSDLFDMT